MSTTYFDGDLVATPKKGFGIKFGQRAVVDQSSNQGFGWRDITGQITVKGVGANDPDWTQIGSSPFFAYKFSINDACWFSYHVPHDIVVPDSNIHFHSHWVSDGTQTASVRWEYTYMYARGFGQDTFNTAGTTVYS